jgi:hypothetical protein
VKTVSLNPELFYDVMACAYRNGVLQKVTVLGGEAAVEVMAEYDYDMDDFVNRVNEMEEWKLQLIDRLVSATGPLFKLATFDPLLKFASRTLDFSLVRKITLEITKITIKIMLIWEAPPSFKERMNSILVKEVL